MPIHKELLEEMISSWTEEQITSYIIKLETREIELHHWLKELRRLRQQRRKKSTPDNGARDGR